MTTAEALKHFRYTAWATRRLLDAARALDPADLSKNLGSSHASILGTLAHTYFADGIWYHRIADPNFPAPDPKAVPPLAQLDPQWRALHEKWEAWVGARSEADLEAPFTYKLMDGSSSSQPLKEVLLHVVNHATLHRGQVMALLRQVGVKPPSTDLIGYYRELAAAAK